MKPLGDGARPVSRAVIVFSVPRARIVGSRPMLRSWSVAIASSTPSPARLTMRSGRFESPGPECVRGGGGRHQRSIRWCRPRERSGTRPSAFLPPRPSPFVDRRSLSGSGFGEDDQIDLRRHDREARGDQRFLGAADPTFKAADRGCEFDVRILRCLGLGSEGREQDREGGNDDRKPAATCRDDVPSVAAVGHSVNRGSGMDMKTALWRGQERFSFDQWDVIGVPRDSRVTHSRMPSSVIPPAPPLIHGLYWGMPPPGYRYPPWFQGPMPWGETGFPPFGLWE